MKKIFKQSVPIYEKGLKDSGFNKKLVYNKENTTSNEQDEKKNTNGKLFGLTRLILIPLKIMLGNFSSSS